MTAEASAVKRAELLRQLNLLLSGEPAWESLEALVDMLSTTVVTVSRDRAEGADVLDGVAAALTRRVAAVWDEVKAAAPAGGAAPKTGRLQ